jgi:hypothetical protein
MKSPEELPLEFKREGDPNSSDGRYMLPHPHIKGYVHHIIFSSQEGWEHLSVTLHKIVTREGRRALKSVDRCCTWAEMCFLKGLFWRVDECVVQYHPPMAEYISNHQFCLHLWKPTAVNMPTPDAVMVGVNSEELNEMMEALKNGYPEIPVEKFYEAIYYSDIRKFKEDREAWLREVERILFI